MSLTNAYHLHQKTGTDFSGVTHRCVSNERRLQVGPVDLPTQRSDEERRDGDDICSVQHRSFIQESFSLLSALNAVVCTLIFYLPLLSPTALLLFPSLISPHLLSS